MSAARGHGPRVPVEPVIFQPSALTAFDPLSNNAARFPRAEGMALGGGGAGLGRVYAPRAAAGSRGPLTEGIVCSYARKSTVLALTDIRFRK